MLVDFAPTTSHAWQPPTTKPNRKQPELLVAKHRLCQESTLGEAFPHDQFRTTIALPGTRLVANAKYQEERSPPSDAWRGPWKKRTSLKAVLSEVNGSFGALGYGQERICLAWRWSASKRPRWQVGIFIGSR